MKTKNFLLSGLLGIALTGFVLTGCHKSSTTPDTDYTAAEDEANATAAMNDTKNVSDASMQGNSSSYGPAHSVKAIYSTNITLSWSIDTAMGTEDTLYITFGNGTTPVYCNDDRYRQGKILVYWNNSTGNLWQTYFDSNGIVNMTFRNYASGNSTGNMIGISGLRTWTNLGKNALSEENWKFNAALTLSYNTGQTATWNSTRTNTLVQPGGLGTTYYYEITGTAYGVSRKGIDYSITIENPLYITGLPWWAGGCKWIEAGTVSVNRSSSTNTLTINFGTLGTCDATAVATLDGVNYTFTMW
jgi:hypothetical protein